ncbi:Chemotaxis protein methyltransferase CheR [hydrothermal vent metagenome]|uniref:protein-glutamate O-methyltransferase n=1 Tax=hydrothermal vent metagenome TaxID=652676 RepID=A0A3B1B3A1_9ZZZZ
MSTQTGSGENVVTDSLLSKDQYDNFRGFLEDSCGIVLGDNKHYLVTSRLNKLTHEFSFDSLSAMLDELKRKNDAKLKERVIDAMTTNETSWFRDNYPFELLKENLIPEIVKNNKPNRFRIWSAACSTGQEPYSISMSINEFQMKSPGVLNIPVEIVGTDISSTVLDMARRAEYDQLSVTRGLPEEKKKLFFQSIDGNRWKLNDKIKSIVKFNEINLLQNYTLIGKFDLIFCRNVLIYFSADLKSDILNRMAKILNPGGFLVLGGSESPTGYCRAFEMTRFPKGVVYRLKDEKS